MICSLRFAVLVATLAIASTPASIARASCVDPAGCLCGLQGDDGIATLAVTVVAVVNGVTQVRVDDVRLFPGQTTAVSEGDVRDVANSEEAVGERYLAILEHCVSCDGCYEYECYGCESCEKGTDRVSLSQQAGTDGIRCAYDGEKVWIDLPTALDMSVSSSCRKQVGTRLEEEGADLGCNDSGIFFLRRGRGARGRLAGLRTRRARHGRPRQEACRATGPLTIRRKTVAVAG